MLGNFSIGDYFKAEIIPWAWEFYTQRAEPRPPDRLWPAVYLDDDEAYDIWVKVGVPRERIKRYGDEHNYWFSGEIGPCGPDSEIYYDFGEQFGCGASLRARARVRALPRDLEPGVHVLLLRRRTAHAFAFAERRYGSWARAERLCVAVRERRVGQEQTSFRLRYGLFLPIIRRVEELSGKRYGEDEKTDRAIRIVAEHSRAVTFLIGDERTPVLPSNEERGYVVRRMLRRAVYFGRRQLGIEEPFMAGDWPTPWWIRCRRPIRSSSGSATFIKEIIGPEERRFDETLSRGLEMLEGVLTKARSAGTISGADVFVLHDTYGFPIEVTREIAAENGLSVDEVGFAAEMERQRERARAGAGGSGAVAADALYSSLGVEATEFSGYDGLESESQRGRAGRRWASAEDRREVGAAAEVLLATDPFLPRRRRPGRRPRRDRWAEWADRRRGYAARGRAADRPPRPSRRGPDRRWR